MPFKADQARTREDAKVRRHRVLGRIELPSNIARSDAVWLVLNQ